VFVLLLVARLVLTLIRFVLIRPTFALCSLLFALARLDLGIVIGVLVEV
jgi:hypothetical protein